MGARHSLSNKDLASNVETIECAKRTMEYRYLLLSIFSLENACLRVYGGMMDDYGQCPLVIKHIAFDY